MEKANYPGDPGGYRKKHRDVRGRGKCRMLCNKDPTCCHWVHYGKHRGSKGKTKIRDLFYIIIQLKKSGKDGAQTLVS